MKSAAIERGALRHPTEHVARPASLPHRARITNDGTLTACLHDGICKLQQMRLITAPDMRNDTHMRRQHQSAKKGQSGAKLAAVRWGIEHPKGQAVTAISDATLNRAKFTATREKFSIKRAIRHVLFPRIRHAQDIAFTGEKLATVPKHPPSVQLFGHEPASGITPLPVFQKSECVHLKKQ
jgi:hypothetical protein